MSEQPTTTSTSTTRKSGGTFTRKLGPLPVWGWMAIVAVIVLAYSFYAKNKQSQQANQSAGGVNSPGGVDASLVPQFINQTYDNDVPPTAPNVTVPVQVTVPPMGGTQPSPNPTPKPVKTPTVHQYKAPTGLKTSKATNTSIHVSWMNLVGVNPPPQSYTVAVFSKAGKLLSQTTVNAPDTVGGKSTTTITGLPKNSQDLEVHVWANGGQLAPPHASSKVNILWQICLW